MSPGEGLSPTDYGWSMKDNLLKPMWFEGPAIPTSLFTDGSNNAEDIEIASDSACGSEEVTAEDYVSDSDGEPWCEESDSEEEEDYL